MGRNANISLVQLQYLVALDQHRHFIKAAEASFVTQPTLSMQIKKLEEELEVKLFDRSRQPIIPTDVGRLIIAQAKEVIKQTQKIDSILQEYKGTVSGDLFLGVIPTVSPYLMPYLISNISKMFPEVRLHVKELLTEEILDRLKNDHLDLGILATPLNMDNFIERPLFYERFLVYLNPEHPSFGKDKIPAEDLLLDKLWLLSEGNCFRNQAVNLCALQEMGLKENMFDYESGSLETLMRIVDLEGGATVIPEWASIELSGGACKRVRHIVQKDMVREVSMIYTRNFAKSRLLDAVSEVVSASIPEKLRGNVGKEVMGILP